jgi:hypothetical protein
VRRPVAMLDVLSVTSVTPLALCMQVEQGAGMGRIGEPQSGA